MIRLPSGRTRYINDFCMATIGVVAASGRMEKPFLKAGDKFHLMKAKGHKYPRTSGRKWFLLFTPMVAANVAHAEQQQLHTVHLQDRNRFNRCTRTRTEKKRAIR
jgi:hypothetical protein